VRTARRQLLKVLSWFIAHTLRACVTRFPTDTTTAADWSAAPLGSKARIGVPSPARSSAEPARPSGRQTSRRTRRTRPTYVRNGLGGFGQRALLCSQTVLPRRCACVTQYSFARSLVRSRPPRQRQTRLRAASSPGEPRPTDRPTGSGWPAVPANIPPGCARAVRLDLTPARERDDRLGRGFGQAARLHHGDPAEAAPGGEHTRTARPVRSRAQLGAEWEHRWRREDAERVQRGCRVGAEGWMQSGSTCRAERVQNGCRVDAELVQSGCRGWVQRCRSPTCVAGP